MGLFRKKPFLDEEVVDWILDSYLWLMKNFGGTEFMKTTPLVEPNAEFFPVKNPKGKANVKEIFSLVQKHAQMEKWDCLLKEGEPEREVAVSPYIFLEHQGEGPPAGTFQGEEKGNQKPTITYNPTLINEPENLIATFAHEFSHYLTFSEKEEPPGGWEMCEPLADLGAIYLGFGVFIVNTQFMFSQYPEGSVYGWATRRMGYLTGNEGLFSLAVFMELTETSEEVLFKHLKSHLKGSYKKAVKTFHENSEDFLKKLPK